MKNPNGFGSVTKLSGRRRKPWVAKVTVGFDKESGKQIQKSIGTFETRADAMKQLSLYQVSKKSKNLALEMDYVNAREIQKKAKISHTFEECVRGAIEREKDGKSKSWIASKRMACKILSELMNKNIDELKYYDVQAIFDEHSDLSVSALTACKVTCKSAFVFAIINEWIKPEDNFIEYIKINSECKRKIKHKPFTRDEIKMIMNANDLLSKIILVYIFTGCRATELLCVEEIHDDYFVCGIKTSNGRHRRIPYHPYIKDYIKDVIYELRDKDYNYVNYRFKNYMDVNGMEHTLHDTRHTFATLSKECNLKPTAVKKLMGHAVKDLTDDVYTHESIEYLKNEIEKIVIN